MPGFNQTGPMGQGPMTGRRMGRCTNFGSGPKRRQDNDENNAPEIPMERGMGRGLGYGQRPRGRGRGMGMRNRFGNR
ncbi:hypothetical protein DSECCO2_65430 [anaerobic digester metagenome]